VLLYRDALALNSVCHRRARDLVAAGYVAIIADMYGTGPGEPSVDDTTRSFLDLQGKPETLRGRVVALFEAAKGVAGVDSKRIAAFGYCFGGQCVLELARSGADARAVVSFHGLLTTQLPAAKGAVKGKVLAICGFLDPHCPPEGTAALQQEMAAADADWHVTVYGNGMHAFTDPEVATRITLPGLKYDPFLDDASWSQANVALKAVFG